jgi:hypothetical protein
MIPRAIPNAEGSKNSQIVYFQNNLFLMIIFFFIIAPNCLNIVLIIIIN